MTLKRIAAALAAALVVASPASAIDLNGKWLIVEALQYSGDGLQRQSKRHVAIQALGGVLQWSVEVARICYVGGRQIHQSMVYGPAATRNGRIDCEQTIEGTASDRDINDDNATYTTTYSNVGELVTLSGRMTWTTIGRGTKTGPFAETTESRHVNDIRQALTVHFTGPDKCEVVSFAVEHTRVMTLSGQPGPGRDQFAPPVNNYTKTIPEARWVVPDPSKCRTMNHADYKGEPLGSAGR